MINLSKSVLSLLNKTVSKEYQEKYINKELRRALLNDYEIVKGISCFTKSQENKIRSQKRLK